MSNLAKVMKIVQWSEQFGGRRNCLVRNVANVLLLFEKEWCRMGVDMRGMMWEKINRRAGAKSARSAVSMTCRGGGGHLVV